MHHHHSHKTIKVARQVAGSLGVFALLFIPSVVFGEVQYQPMVGFPGVAAGTGTTLGQYLPAAYKMLIGIAVILAVIMLVMGGVKYIGSGASEKLRGEGHNDIWGAITGLLIIAISWIVLYAINPDLTIIRLNIAPAPAPIAGTAPATTGVTGSSGGLTAGGGSCTPSCITLGSNIPQKAPGAGCAAPGPCTVSPLIAGKLDGLNQSLQNANVGWTVSEMWPPTRVHKAACQNAGPQAGTCVDASLSPSFRNPDGINTFTNAATNNNLRAVYEVPTQARASELQKAGVSNVKYVPGITGEHFSVYNS